MHHIHVGFAAVICLFGFTVVVWFDLQNESITRVVTSKTDYSWSLEISPGRTWRPLDRKINPPPPPPPPPSHQTTRNSGPVQIPPASLASQRGSLALEPKQHCTSWRAPAAHFCFPVPENHVHHWHGYAFAYWVSDTSTSLVSFNLHKQEILFFPLWVQ